MANQYGNVTVRGDGMLLTILELVTCGVNESVGEKEALDIGRKVVESIRHTFGGEVVYVCKGRSIDAIMLSNQIWAGGDRAANRDDRWCIPDQILD